MRLLKDIAKITYACLHILAFAFQSASKEHLVRSVEVVVTATQVFFVAIRSAADVFVRKGGLGTSAKKVPFKVPFRLFSPLYFALN